MLTSFPVFIARARHDKLVALFIETWPEILVRTEKALQQEASFYAKGSLAILNAHQRDIAHGRKTLQDFPKLDLFLKPSP